MNRVFLSVLAVMVLATSAQARNKVYGVGSGGVEGEGYKLFVSDRILETVAKVDNIHDKDDGYCKSADEYMTKSLGDVNNIRSDNRLTLGNRKISYFDACITYDSIVEQLKSADDIRRLWLLFGDSATDDVAVEILNSSEGDEEKGLLIELKRLAIVSKYIEFFTKNKEWKLNDYTFLSQAFKSRKGKALSPVYGQFIEALLTGDAEKALRVVKSIDLDNLGTRFNAAGTRESLKTKGTAPGN